MTENKYYPPKLEEAILKSLSYYPQLKETEIHFTIVTPIGTSIMQAQPLPKTLFNRCCKRAYVIKISECFIMNGKTFCINEMPFDVLVGWIGHELGHVMDYLNRSLPSLMFFGVGYMCSGPYMRKAERTADRFAIKQGMGKYIIATKKFILKNTGCEKYRQKIRRFYPSPEDLQLMVKAHEITMTYRQKVNS